MSCRVRSRSSGKSATGSQRSAPPPAAPLLQRQTSDDVRVAAQRKRIVHHAELHAPDAGQYAHKMRLRREREMRESANCPSRWLVPVVRAAFNVDKALTGAAVGGSDSHGGVFDQRLAALCLGDLRPSNKKEEEGGERGSIWQQLESAIVDLIHAARRGDVGAVRYILTLAPRLVLTTDLHGNDALYTAAQCGHLGLVEYLLTGAPIAARDSEDGRNYINALGGEVRSRLIPPPETEKTASKAEREGGLREAAARQLPPPSQSLALARRLSDAGRVLICRAVAGGGGGVLALAEDGSSAAVPTPDGVMRRGLRGAFALQGAVGRRALPVVTQFLTARELARIRQCCFMFLDVCQSGRGLGALKKHLGPFLSVLPPFFNHPPSLQNLWPPMNEVAILFEQNHGHNELGLPAGTCVLTGEDALAFLLRMFDGSVEDVLRALSHTNGLGGAGAFETAPVTREGGDGGGYNDEEEAAGGGGEDWTKPFRRRNFVAFSRMGGEEATGTQVTFAVQPHFDMRAELVEHCRPGGKAHTRTLSAARPHDDDDNKKTRRKARGAQDDSHVRFSDGSQLVVTSAPKFEEGRQANLRLDSDRRLVAGLQNYTSEARVVDPLSDAEFWVSSKWRCARDGRNLNRSMPAFGTFNTSFSAPPASPSGVGKTLGFADPDNPANPYPDDPSDGENPPKARSPCSPWPLGKRRRPGNMGWAAKTYEHGHMTHDEVAFASLQCVTTFRVGRIAREEIPALAEEFRDTATAKPDVTARRGAPGQRALDEDIDEEKCCVLCHVYNNRELHIMPGRHCANILPCDHELKNGTRTETHSDGGIALCAPFSGIDRQHMEQLKTDLEEAGGMAAAVDFGQPLYRAIAPELTIDLNYFRTLWQQFLFDWESTRTELQICDGGDGDVDVPAFGGQVKRCIPLMWQNQTHRELWSDADMRARQSSRHRFGELSPELATQVDINPRCWYFGACNCDADAHPADWLLVTGAANCPFAGREWSSSAPTSTKRCPCTEGAVPFWRHDSDTSDWGLEKSRANVQGSFCAFDQWSEGTIFRGDALNNTVHCNLPTAPFHRKLYRSVLILDDEREREAAGKPVCPNCWDIDAMASYAREHHDPDDRFNWKLQSDGEAWQKSVDKFARLRQREKREKERKAKIERHRKRAADAAKERQQKAERRNWKSHKGVKQKRREKRETQKQQREEDEEEENPALHMMRQVVDKYAYMENIDAAEELEKERKEAAGKYAAHHHFKASLANSGPRHIGTRNIGSMGVPSYPSEYKSNPNLHFGRPSKYHYHGLVQPGDILLTRR